MSKRSDNNKMLNKKIWITILSLLMITCETNAAKLRDDNLVCNDYESIKELYNALQRKDRNSAAHLLDLNICLAIPDEVEYSYSLITSDKYFSKIRITMKGKEDLILWTFNDFIKMR